MRLTALGVATLIVVTSGVASAQQVTKETVPGKTLDIYVVDVEGGNAVLFVPPSGE